MAGDLKKSLDEFVRFAQTLRGDEKSEAQTFLDRFFRALGHDGVIEAGGTFEFRVAKKPGSPQLELIKGNGARPKGGKKFADLLWPDRVLIEMKSRGEKLENPEQGNAAYIFKENWTSLSRRTKQEPLSSYNYCVKRVLHRGDTDWKWHIRRSLGCE